MRAEVDALLCRLEADGIDGGFAAAICVTCCARTTARRHGRAITAARLRALASSIEGAA